jgi:hypothetical protein
VRDLSGLNGSAKPWSCYPQELMPTEHIVALLIAERDKLLGCRFEPGSYFSRFWPQSFPFRVSKRTGKYPNLPPGFQNRG